MRQIVTSIRAILAFSLLLGVVYPLCLTGFAGVFFQEKAAGSFVKNQQGVVVGSELIGQEFKSSKYFWPRPSAVNYDAMSSGASNLSMSSQQLNEKIQERLKIGQKFEGLNASASGLDPHISVENAKYQAERIAQERKIEIKRIYDLIDSLTEQAEFGIFGQARVNVLKINLQIDQL